MERRTATGPRQGKPGSYIEMMERCRRAMKSRGHRWIQTMGVMPSERVESDRRAMMSRGERMTWS